MKDPMNPMDLARGAALVAALATPGVAQIEHYDVWGSQQATYGRSLTVLGDVDLDGVADWATADSGYDAGAGNNAGRVWVHSGATGALLSRVTGGGAGHFLGEWIEGMGDVDGDGRADLAVRTHPDGLRVELRSGATGELLYSLTPPQGAPEWGWRFFRLDDLNGDGVAELAMPSRGTSSNDPDRVSILSGADGSLVRTLEAPNGQWECNFGDSVASAGDLDGDGVSEVLVGATHYCAICLYSFDGGVFVFRGSDGSLIRSHHATGGTAEELGRWVIGLGDVNDDGVPDYAAQAGYPNEIVWLFSGLDGALLHEYEFPVTPGQHWIGMGLWGVDDLDGDGARELLVSPDVLSHEPYSLIVSCKPPYETIERIPGRFSANFATWSVASPGDLTGDGTPDLLFGESAFVDHLYPDFADGLHVGRVTAVALDERSVDAQRECPPTTNSTGLAARIWYRGSLRLSDGTLEVLAWNLPPSQFGVVFHGPEATEVPFGNGVRCAGGALTRLPAVNAGPDGVVQVPVPAELAPPPGVTTRLQYWFRDPAAGGATFDLSDAVAVLAAP